MVNWFPFSSFFCYGFFIFVKSLQFILAVVGACGGGLLGVDVRRYLISQGGTLSSPQKLYLEFGNSTAFWKKKGLVLTYPFTLALRLKEHKELVCTTLACGQ